MKLSKAQIRTIEDELENRNSLLIRSHGSRILIRRRQRRIYPSEQNTKIIRVYKEDWEKIKARAEHEGTSMSVALGKMVIEALRCKIIQLLKSMLPAKVTLQ